MGLKFNPFTGALDQVAVVNQGDFNDLFIDADGNVGVGTASPRKTGTGRTAVTLNAPTGQLSILEFTVNEALTGYLYSNASQTTIDATTRPFTVRNSGAERLRIDSTGKLIHIGGGGSYTTPAVQFNGSAPADSFVVNSSGNVGLGTSSPQYPLQINATNPRIRLQETSSGGSKRLDMWVDPSTAVAYIGANQSAQQLSFQTANTDRIYINNSGNVGIGTSSPSGRLHVIADAITTGAGLQTWGYNALQPSYQLRLRTDVSAGVVKYNFNLLNNGTEYDNNLVLDRGNVGIGTTSPASKLHLSGGAENVLLQTTNSTGDAFFGIRSGSYGLLGTGDAYIYTNDGDIALLADGTSDVIKFASGGSTERMRIDSDGRLLVGTPTSAGVGSTAGAFIQVEHNPSVTGNGISITSVNNNAASLYLANKHSSTACQSGDDLGVIQFVGHDGNDLVSRGAAILAEADGNWATDDAPGRLVFSTNAGSPDTAPTERMTINSAGGFRLFSTGSSTRISSTESAGTAEWFLLGSHSATAINTGTNSFIVYTNGDVKNTNNSYDAISDSKLKENIVDAGSQWSDIKSLQVRNYNFKEETGHQTHTQIGLIAQELELTSPGLVTTSPDLDDEGNDLGTVTKGVKYSVLYMKAVKALQEAMERIETLEAKVAALEAN